MNSDVGPGGPIRELDSWTIERLEAFVAAQHGEDLEQVRVIAQSHVYRSDEPALAEAADDLRCLGDLGYEGESDTIAVAFKKPKDGKLTNEQQHLNQAHNGIRAIGERGNSLLKTTFKALRNVSLNPWRIGAIVAAALVLLHADHARTT